MVSARHQFMRRARAHRVPDRRGRGANAADEPVEAICVTVPGEFVPDQHRDAHRVRIRVLRLVYSDKAGLCREEKSRTGKQTDRQ